VRETDMEAKWQWLSWFCSAAPGRSHDEHLPLNSSRPFPAYRAEAASGPYTWVPLILSPPCTAAATEPELACGRRLKAKKGMAFADVFSKTVKGYWYLSG